MKILKFLARPKFLYYSFLIAIRYHSKYKNYRNPRSLFKNVPDWVVRELNDMFVMSVAKQEVLDPDVKEVLRRACNTLHYRNLMANPPRNPYTNKSNENS